MTGQGGTRSAILVGAVLALVGGASLLLGGAASAQQIQLRATGTTTLRYMELRPLVADSVAVTETSGDGLLRRSSDGHVVRCVTGAAFCGFLASGPVLSSAPVSQDLILSAWGLGRGVRAYAHLRGRGVVDGEETLWPRADDAFDALAAYVELDRSAFRVRAGRQWVTSGLGYHNFDGAAVEVRPLAGLALELYGGRSLIRGISEPRTGDALAALESFAPDEGDLLVGTRVRWRRGPGLGLAAVYQREIRRDRKGLYAERLALDGAWRRARGELSGALEADLATRTLNDARLEAMFRLDPGLGVAALYRWYRPYFEAWTIWGAFDPVGYSEVGGRAWWRPPEHPLTAELRFARRSYAEAHAASTFGTFRGTGWRAVASASVAPAASWMIQVRLGTDIGFGAARDDASLRVERRFGDRARLGASLQAFERVYEFRVDEGTVWGAGLDGGLRVSSRLRLQGSVTNYHHRAGQELPTPDWSQIRGSLTARWTVGAEPTASSAGVP